MPPPATQRDVGSDQPTQGQVTIKKDKVGFQLKWIVKGKNPMHVKNRQAKRGKTTTERRVQESRGIGGEAGKILESGSFHPSLPAPRQLTANSLASCFTQSHQDSTGEWSMCKRIKVNKTMVNYL